MKRSLIRGLAAMFAAAYCGSLSAQSASVAVNAGAPLGTPPELLGGNVWIVAKNDLRNRYYVERFFADHHVNVIQYTLSFDLFLQGTQSLDDYLTRLDRLLLREDTVPRLLMAKVRDADARLVIGFEPYAMPAWLSSRRGDDRRAFVNEEWWTIERVSPPRDYALAGRLAGETLRFLRDRVGIRKLGLYVGHEPETQWLGDESTLFRYYESMARAAKQLDADIKVGGLGSFNAIQGAKAGCDDKHFTPATQTLCRSEGGWENKTGEPVTHSFMRFVAQRNVPLDFINWHAFGVLPPDKHLADAKVLQQWLRDAQLRNVALYPSDWTYWAGPYPADYLDTQEAAAYVISSLSFMWKGGVAWHGHDLNIEVSGFEAARAKERGNTEFLGDWPLMTRRGVVKPVYNALRAVGMLTAGDGQPRMLDTSVNGAPDLGALATRRSDGVYVLLSNYVPSKQRAPIYALNRFLTRLGFSADEISMLMKCGRKARTSPKLAEQCRQFRDQRMATENQRDGAAFIASARECVSESEGNRAEALACLREKAQATGNPDIKRIAEETLRPLAQPPRPLSVAVDIDGLPFDPGTGARGYWIDGRNANSCAANKATERRATGLPCGSGGAIDQAVAPLLASAKQASRTKDPAQRGATSPSYETLRDGIDKINARPEVGLTAAATPVPVSREGGKAKLQLTLEPNSAVLVVLQPR